MVNFRNCQGFRRSLAEDHGYFMTRRLFNLVFGALAAATGCSHNGPAWTYAGPEGAPPAWSTLDPSYAACSAGKSQSPVNVTEVIPRDLPNLAFRYTSAPLRLLNNGRTVVQAFAPGQSIAVGTMQYALETLTLHTPSEHRAAGRAYPMEMQLQHKNAQGNLLVVSVLIKEGANNPALGVVLSRLPAETDDVFESTDVLPMMQMLPKKRTYMRYSGSLTTPPCWENVTWVVLTEPIEASKDQISLFWKILPNNVRPLAPMGRRTVFMDTTP